jgi:hypothetical protein
MREVLARKSTIKRWSGLSALDPIPNALPGAMPQAGMDCTVGRKMEEVLLFLKN